MSDETKKTVKAMRNGRYAALSGCYRLLVCADSEAERQAWYRGWDAVPAGARGTLPGRSPVPAEPSADQP